MILYTFLWCMRIRPSTSDISSLFIYFLIWLWGRITSPRVWLGAGGQGVTLKLAWGPSNSSPWICILFLMSFPFFFFLSSFYALFFSSFFVSSCIFENGFGTCRLHFSFFSKSGVTSFSLFMSLLLLLLFHFFQLSDFCILVGVSCKPVYSKVSLSCRP